MRELLYADLVLTNGTVYTMDSGGTSAEAVAVKGGRIVATGSAADVRELTGGRTRVVDLAGRTVLPGFADCHMHLATDAANASMIDVRDLFTDVRSIPQILSAMAAKAAITPKGEWIIARGSPIQELRLAEKRRLTRADLDPVLPDHPAYVSFGAHITQANSLALAARGITRETPDPPGGTIERDPATGEPTGVLKERAQFLLKEKQQPISQADLERNVLTLLESCRRRGATTIHDIVASGREILAYVNLANAGLLPVRVHLIVRVIESKVDKESLLNLGMIQNFGGDMLKLGGIKMSIDGGTTGRNGAFSEPLIGDPTSTGIIRIDQDELDDTVMRYHTMGMRICTHAVGDVAHRMALSAYEKALVAHPRADHRHRVEHLGNWMFTPEELAWAKRLDILPMPNPTGLRHVADIYAPLLGEERMRWSYRFGTIVRAGFRSSFASDGPGGYPCDPLRDISTLVTRRTANGNVINKDEALTMDQALRAQTINAAYTGFEENRLGSIEPGKLADLVVLPADPYTYPAEELIDVPVDMTVVGGEVTSLAG
jgi:predicted amidohydrolase YtcJ